MSLQSFWEVSFFLVITVTHKPHLISFQNIPLIYVKFTAECVSGIVPLIETNRSMLSVGK